MARMVLLVHESPGQPRHYDWLFQRPEPAGAMPPAPPLPEDRCLRAFRVRVRVDDPACAAFEAEAMPDHRALYLDFQGALSGGRGAVSRLARGDVAAVEESDGRLVLHGSWRGPGPPGPAVWKGVHVGGGAWRFNRTAGAP